MTGPGRDAAVLLSLSLAVIGCATTGRVAKHREAAGDPRASARALKAGGTAEETEPTGSTLPEALSPPAGNAAIRLASAESEALIAAEDPPGGPAVAEPEDVENEGRVAPIIEPPPVPTQPRTLTLDDVLESVESRYPLLLAAFQSRGIVVGEQLEALGLFDTKLTGSALHQPLGFYENYRFSLGLEQPTYWGGRLFSNYRIGRGDFEPWYKERATEEGGELSAGLAVPLAQNRDIDLRRWELWRTTYGRTAVEFDIQLELIGFFQAAAFAYWDWVAAGQIYRISEDLLELAVARVEYLEEQVEAERLPPIALVDNQRLIVSREAKLIEARQKLQVSAIKLSLFLLTDDGAPIVPEPEWLPPVLPRPVPFDLSLVELDVAVALANRPELRQLTVLRRQLEVDLALARNQVEPTVDVLLTGSQDLGAPADKTDDKGQFILEAGLLAEVPLQRRKGRGKMYAVESKLAQNAAKLEFTRNKIVADVQSVDASLAAAYEQYQRATESVLLNRQLEQAERVRLEEQRSDLLLVNLREQATADAAMAQVSAWLAYFQAQAARQAALAVDSEPEPATEPLPPPVIVPPPAPPLVAPED